MCLAVFGLLVLFWWAARAGYRQALLAEERALTASELFPHGDALTGALNLRLGLLRGLRAFVEAHTTAATFGEEFDLFAPVLFAGARGVRNLTVAPRGIHRYVYPRADNEAVLGHNLLEDARAEVRADVERAIESGGTVLSGPYELRQGGLGLVARQAVYREGRFWGLVTLALDVPPILDEAGLTPPDARLHYALRVPAGRVFSGERSLFEGTPIVYRVQLPGSFWELGAAPAAGWQAAIRGPLLYFDGAALALVLLVTGLVYLTASHQTRLAFVVRERTREITEINEELEKDIAKRKQTEKELRKSEERYRSLFETTGSATVCLAPDHRILEFNREAERASGWKREEVLGKDAFEIFLSETEREAPAAAVARVLAGEDVRNFEVPVRSRDGSELVFLWNATRLLDAQGQPVGIIAVGQDITEWKETENWLQRVIDTTQDAFVSIDPQGRVDLFNPAAERIFGYSQADVTGEKLDLFIPEPQLFALESDRGDPPDHEPTQERQAVGQTHAGKGRRKSGEEFPVEFSVAEVTAEGQRRYAVFIRDVSERKRLQDLLIEQERLAAIGTTAAGLLHEIANPLNGMSMTVQLLERRLRAGSEGLSDRIMSSIRALREEISRVNKLLQHLRFVSRRPEYKFRPTSLASVASEVCELEQETFRGRGVKVQREVPADLPPVLADRDQLKQALLNLCKNAVEAMPQGGSLTVRAYRGENQVTLEVSDSGVGIPAGMDIFEPFATTKPKGTGLGLMIVRQVAAAHGGAISFERNPGGGTVFRFSLPVSQPGCPTTRTA